MIFEDQNQEYNGIICFTKNIYDFELLFSKKKHNFEISSNNIDLVLNQKYLIKPSFAQHVASLTYDLSVYKQFFSGLDNEIKQEKPDYKKKIEKYIINNEGKKFLNFFDLTIQDLEREVADYTKVEHNTHGFYLRRQVWDIIQTSAFLNRTNTRPRGYAGDSRILYMIYQNKFKGNGIFAKLMHKHPLETVAAKAVRNRKQIVSNYIRQEYQKHKLFDKSSFKFMSIACGPAIELKNIFSSKDEIQKMECKLLDQDTLALTEAKSLIAGLEKKHNSKLNVEYIQDSVRTLICNPNLKNMLGQFHVIYSLGLFDYLTPPTARKVIRQLYDLLLPGGSLLIGNFHINNPTIIYMEYWGDWVLYYRT
ncbi:MAG: class I SAM-dependent methyltransferase, partial [Spirochaetota bacterium]|nr:class I SAM-dependent methyltransferase [Spirochaetota bacterium]